MGVASTIAKNSVFSFITTAFSTSAVFVVGIILARYFGTEQYGLYSFMMWLLSTAALIIDLGVGEMARRFIAEASGKNSIKGVEGITQMALVVRAASAIVVALLIIALSSYLARLFNIPTNHTSFIIIAALLLPYTLVATIGNVFNGFQKFEYATWLQLVVSPIRVVLVIVLVFVGSGVETILIMYAAVWMLGLLVGLVLLSRLVSVKHLFRPRLLEPGTRNSAIKFSIAAVGIVGVDYFLWGQAEVLFLGMFRSVEEVGFYNIAHKIPIMAISLIPFVFGRVLMPAVAEQYGKGDMEKIKRIYVTAARYLMILSLPIAAGGIALARPVIVVLFGEEYAPAIIIMQIALIPFAVRGLTHAVSSIIYGMKEPAYLLKIGVILIVVSIGLNLWLIPLYGAIGAVIATSVPRVFSLPLYVRFVSKKIGSSWPMVDTLKTALAAIAMGLVVFVVQYYTGNVLGLVLGIIVGLIVYAIALPVMGVLNKRDLDTFRSIQGSLPTPFRKSYLTFLNTIQKMMRQTAAEE